MNYYNCCHLLVCNYLQILERNKNLLINFFYIHISSYLVSPNLKKVIILYRLFYDSSM